MSKTNSSKTKTKTKNKPVQVKNQDLKQLEYIAKTCGGVTKRLDSMREELYVLQEIQNKEQLFIKMKRVEHQLQLIEAKLDKLREDIEIGEDTFEIARQLVDILKN